MKKLKQVVNFFYEKLDTIYDRDELDGLIYWTIESYFNLSRSKFKLIDDRVLAQNEIEFLLDVIKRLSNNEPIQYIFGETTFYDLPFKVDKNCLIPRPETEELVNWVLENPKSKILDLGTGSGCIAISVKKNCNADVSAIDISEKALELASYNAIKNNVSIKFSKEDIFEIDKLEKVDVIISNPPYVLESDKNKMKENVLQFEPHQALFVPDEDPLKFYKKIISIAKKSLNKNGYIYFEIHENKANEIIDLFCENYFSNIEVKTDLQGKQRMIRAQFIKE